MVFAGGYGGPVIIGVPLDNPSAPEMLGKFATQTNQGCYDVSFYLPKKLAACAAFNETQIWDVAEDPTKPVVLSRIVNPLMEHQIHAAFSWDGTTLIIANEGLPNAFSSTCDGGTPSPKAALWFYDITTPEVPQLSGYFQIPQTSQEFCSVQNFTVVPVAGRDILTAGWYTGGSTIVDFTDVSKTGSAKQIGFYQGPWADDSNRSVVLTAYWYNGQIYAPNFDVHFPLGLPPLETDRSLDVLAVDEILDGAIPLPYYNFGLQEEIDGLTPHR